MIIDLIYILKICGNVLNGIRRGITSLGKPGFKVHVVRLINSLDIRQGSVAHSNNVDHDIAR
jgi:hypothetical protein